jgi:hypothetical protein
VLAVHIETSPTYTGSSETDIVYQHSHSGFTSSETGMTWCDDPVSQIACDQQYVRFYYASLGPEIICHETGHAVGLTHGDDAYPYEDNDNSSLHCMETPNASVHPELGSHNAAEINATY